MSYWSDRQKQLYKAMEKDEKATKKRLSSFYDREFAKLDKQIASFYQKFGQDNIIEYRNLMQKLPKEDILLLIEQFDEFARKYPQYSHLLPVRENIYKLNRLEGLQYSVRMGQLEIGAVNNEEITKFLNKQAERGINASAELLGFGKNYYALNPNIAKEFVDKNWSYGSNFSQRIWGNAEKLANYLNTDIAQGIARGESYAKLTKQLRDRFSKVSRNDAYRLMYTEGTYVMAESSMKPFIEDFNYYKISTVGDGRVCPICRSMAEQVFEIKDRTAGDNFPPFHPWCRCTFTIEVDDWDKWMDDYVAKHGNREQGEKIADRLSDEVNTMLLSTHRTGKEFVKVINEFKSDIDPMMTRSSKWKGKAIINHWLLNQGEAKAGIKAWTCNILIRSDADDTTALHELLHSYSGSYVTKTEYEEKGYAFIEEPTIAFLAENYMKSIGKDYHRSYRKYTDILYELNKYLELYETDLEFAKALVNIPIQDRYDWLQDKVVNVMMKKDLKLSNIAKMQKGLEDIFKRGKYELD